MRNFYKNVAYVLLIVLISVVAQFLMSFVLHLLNITDEKSDYYTGNATILTAIIAVVGVYFTIKHNNEIKRKELLDNLDSKSEWRKNLYDVASKTYIDTDDVYRVLASLRYFPHKSIDPKNEEIYFHEATRIIYSDLYAIIEEYKKKIDGNLKKEDGLRIPILTFEQSEKVRLYTKYLLKHHWEYNKDKVSFTPDKEKKVWNETQDLINCNSKKYFQKVTKFNIYKKHNNPKLNFVIAFSIKLHRWVIIKKEK